MSKQILFNEDAQSAMLIGMNKVADAVVSTFGPKGRNVAFDQKYDVPLVTNDGYAIARQIELKDKFENLGASILKEAAIKSNETSGDGTTASIVLARSIINDAYKAIAAGSNPIFLKKGIDEAAKVVLNTLDDNAIKVNDVKSIKNIATISANNDLEIGELIGKVYEELGFSPVVNIEDTQMANTTLTISHGCRIDAGYLSHYFLTDKVKNICELQDPYIFVCKDEIKDIDEIYNLLEDCVNNKVTCAIIARDVTGTAISALARNAEAGVLKIVALKGPGYSDTRDRNLNAIAAITGATVVDSAYMDIKTCGLEVCGRAKKIVVEKGTTTIEQPACPDSENVLTMKKQIAEKMKTETRVYERDKLDQSMGLLNSAMALISVGGTSELEMFERKYRIEDALNAAERAASDGIVPGGGKALLLCKEPVKAFCKTLTGDESVGANIVLNILEAPIRQIAENAGVDGSVVVDTVLKNKNKNYGYNALTDEYGDLIKLEVIDPVTVIKNSFANAISIASTFITADVAIVEK